MKCLTSLLVFCLMGCSSLKHKTVISRTTASSVGDFIAERAEANLACNLSSGANKEWESDVVNSTCSKIKDEKKMPLPLPQYPRLLSHTYVNAALYQAGVIQKGDLHTMPNQMCRSYKEYMQVLDGDKITIEDFQTGDVIVYQVNSHSSESGVGTYGFAEVKTDEGFAHYMPQRKAYSDPISLREASVLCVMRVR